MNKTHAIFCRTLFVKCSKWPTRVVNGKNKCGQPGSYPYCFKKLKDLLRQRNAKEYCLPDKVLMVDDCRHRNVYNGDFACYFPISWMGERSLPNQRNVIPNICTALLPFIFGLWRYSSVRRFLEENELDGKFKWKFLKPWHIRRVCIRSDHLVGLPVHDVKNSWCSPECTVVHCMIHSV